MKTRRLVCQVNILAPMLFLETHGMVLDLSLGLILPLNPGLCPKTIF